VIAASSSARSSPAREVIALVPAMHAPEDQPAHFIDEVEAATAPLRRHAHPREAMDVGLVGGLLQGLEVL